MKDYYEANATKLKNKSKKHYEKTKEQKKIKTIKSKTAEERYQYGKEYRELNKDRLKEYRKKYLQNKKAN